MSNDICVLSPLKKTCLNTNKKEKPQLFIFFKIRNVINFLFIMNFSRNCIMFFFLIYVIKKKILILYFFLINQSHSYQSHFEKKDI
jgi:hypothetical protein